MIISENQSIAPEAVAIIEFNRNQKGFCKIKQLGREEGEGENGKQASAGLAGLKDWLEYRPG